MNNNKTLYISDLDGTLLNHDAKLSEYTTKSLNALIANGLNFSVATARLLTPVRKILADVRINVPVILMNGVLIYDIGCENYLKINSLSSDSVSQIIQAIRKFKVTGFMYELDNGELKTYHESFEQNPPDDYVQDRIERYRKDFMHAEGFPDKLSENIIYFTLINTEEKLQPIHNALANEPGINQTLYKNVYSENLWYLEVFSNEASKLNAVTYLRKEYGFDRIIAFGDNHNDLSLFEASDIKVAVENATPEIKGIADYVCKSNENDGVAKWLEENASV